MPKNNAVNNRKRMENEMKHRLKIWLFAALFALTGCSNRNAPADMPAQGGGERKEQISSEPESEAVKEQGQDMDADEYSPAEAAEALNLYAQNLSICDLSDLSLSYERVSGEYTDYFYTQGLKGITEKLAEKPAGCLCTEVWDFDADGMPELLTFELEETDETYQVKAVMYEYQNGTIAGAADIVILENLLGGNIDSAEIRFLVKDGKYICVDSWQYTFVAADGVSIDLAAFYYDGSHFTEMFQVFETGSDFGGTGKESTELIEQLHAMGYDRSAAAVYDRDVFHLYAADEGVEALLKIRLVNSMQTGETDWTEMPTAFIRQISGETAGQYMLPESNSRKLELFDLSGMTKEHLRIARNEIYARYGWQFETPDLEKYFEARTWYVPSENVDDTILSEAELANLALLQEAEKTAPEAGEPTGTDIQGTTELTAFELGQISQVLCEIDAYGFLCSFYTDVRDAELDQVFYTGAGIRDEAFIKEVRDDYLKAVHAEEFHTDFLALRETDMDALLKKRTGYGLSDMRKPLGWTYLTEQKAYCMEAGDTNYMEAAVIQGLKTEDGMYYIAYENPALAYTDDSALCRVTLRKQGDTYQFVANEKFAE